MLLLGHLAELFISWSKCCASVFLSVWMLSIVIPSLLWGYRQPKHMRSCSTSLEALPACFLGVKTIMPSTLVMSPVIITSLWNKTRSLVARVWTAWVHYSFEWRLLYSVHIVCVCVCVCVLAYQITYGDALVWEPYRRNHKGAIPPEKTRKTCIVCGRVSCMSECLCGHY